MTSKSPHSDRPEDLVEASYVCMLCGKTGVEEFTCAEDDCVVQSSGTLFAGTYLLKRKMASGGYGTVFESEHLFLKKRIAIKILHTHMLKDKSQLLRFQREAQILSTLQHVNVVSLSDHGWAPRPFIAMEYVEGETLQSLTQKGPVTAAKAVHICKQICRGLGAAHDVGIIHRDLKPVNIVLCDNSETPLVKILDFGIAKLDEGTLTATGEIIGSPSYMSPEQCLGGQVDTRADIYAVGCLMYEVLTGKLPFDGENHYVVLRKQIMEMPAPMDEVFAGIPRELQSVVVKCLAKEPQARFQTTEELSHSLESPKLLAIDKRRHLGGRSLVVWPGMLLLVAWSLTCSIAGIKPQWCAALMACTGVIAEVYWLYCIFHEKHQLKVAGHKNKVSPFNSVLLILSGQLICAVSAVYCNSALPVLMQEGTVLILTLAASVALCIGWLSFRDFSDFVYERRGAENSIHVLACLYLANAMSVWAVIPLLSNQVTGDWVLTSALFAAGMFSVAFCLLYLLKSDLDSCTGTMVSGTAMSLKKANGLFCSIIVMQVLMGVSAEQAQYSRVNDFLLQTRDQLQQIHQTVTLPYDTEYFQYHNLSLLYKHKYPMVEEWLCWESLATGRFKEAGEASDRFCSISADLGGIDSAYGPLLRFTWLVLVHASDSDFAETRSLMKRVADKAPSEWPSPAASFLAGDLSREKMFKSAGHDLPRLAEAHFYSGIAYLLKREEASARRDLEATVASGQEHLGEFRVARYLLDKSGALDDSK